jgi:amino acid transporter
MEVVMDQPNQAVAGRAGQPQLRREAVGLREVLFQSITAMAPGAAIAASIPAGAAYAGGSLPLAVVLALVACLFTAIAIGELARHIPAAGSVATYTAKGLHPAAGFIVGWGYLFVELLVPPLLFLQLGFTIAATLHNQWPSISPDLWWPWVILGSLIVLFAGYRGVRFSARLGTVLGAFEIAVFVVLAFLFIINAGSHNDLSVFGTGHTPDAYKGITGIVAGSIYTVLAFAGFEAAAPLAEEAVNPKRNIRLAVVGATLGIGIIYIFTTYAVDVAFGPDKFATFGGAGASSWQGLAQASYGIFWVLVFFAVVNSCIANSNAGSNVSTRMAFALGRIRLLPRVLSTIHPRYRSPYVAVLVQWVIGLAVPLILGFKYDPVTAFVFVATIIVLVIVAVYIVCDVACIGFYLRIRRQDFNPLLHLVIPILGIAAFVPALLAAAGIQAFSFIAPLTSPASYSGIIVGVWLLLGLAYLGYLMSRRPDGVAEMTRIHLEEDPVESAAVARG